MGNVNSTNTEPEIVVETFNETEVMRMIDEFDGLGKNVFNSIESMDSLVADNVQVVSGAVAGSVGGKLFKEWSENCVPLLNYSRFFDGISESMRRIYNRSAETAEVIESIYKTTDPNALPNTTSTDLASGNVPVSETTSQEVTTSATDSNDVPDSAGVNPISGSVPVNDVDSQDDATPSNETTDVSDLAPEEEKNSTTDSDEEQSSANKGDE